MTTPALELVIGTSTHTRHLTPNTVGLYDNLDARTALSFALRVQTTDSYRPALGSVVYLSNASSTCFGGTLDNFTETTFPFSSAVEYRCNAVDFSQMVGKRLVSVSYTSSGYDADIIAAINAACFTNEGILTNTSFNSTGIVIPEINFNYVPGNEALNTICNMTGRSWYIDAQKRLRYFAREQNPAPFNISSTSNNWRSITVRRSRDKYRNREYLYNAYDLKNAYVEGFPGDGKTKTFALTYPVYSVPTITLNASSRSVGRLNIDSTDFDYYWQKESNIITQNPSSAITAVSSSDSLLVIYSGIYPIISKTENEVEIAARATIEGNSGIYEWADTADHTYTAAGALQEGQGYVDRYGNMPEVVTFETDYDGLQSGQLINIVISQNGLNGTYLIQTVSARDVDLATMRYSVTAISGVDRGGWVNYFRSLTKKEAFRTGTFDNVTVWTQKQSVENYAAHEYMAGAYFQYPLGTMARVGISLVGGSHVVGISS